MTVLVHISDTHFGTEIPAAIDAVIRTIHVLKPDIVILSGDVTQRARMPQFRKAAEFIEKLPVKTKLVIPGNHDIPLFNLFARFLAPYRNYERTFGPRDGIWRDEGIAIVNYNATSPIRHVDGKLTKRYALKKLTILKEYSQADDILIACAHQPLVTAWPQDDSETLINRGETALIWSQHHIDLVLSGHVHVPLLATTHKSFPDLPRHFILAGAGTAVSYRTRPGAPNSFNAIAIHRENGMKTISVSRHDYDEKLAQFVAWEPVYFERGPDGWQEIALTP